MNDFMKGVRYELPLALSAIPFGLILGASFKAWNIPYFLGAATSFVIFAGSSQFIVLQMMAVKAPAFAIIFAALATNLRHVFYTLKLIPYFNQLSFGKKLTSAYLLTDECFAAVHEMEKKEPLSFEAYLGAGLTLWLSWNVSTSVGYGVGNIIPAGLHLEKTIDFLFLAILAQQVQNRATFVSASCAAFASVMTSFLPYKMNIIVGLLFGFIGQRTWFRRHPHE